MYSPHRIGGLVVGKCRPVAYVCKRLMDLHTFWINTAWNTRNTGYLSMRLERVAEWLMDWTRNPGGGGVWGSILFHWASFKSTPPLATQQKRVPRGIGTRYYINWYCVNHFSSRKCDAVSQGRWDSERKPIRRGNCECCPLNLLGYLD